MKPRLLLAAVVAALTLSPLARAADTTPNDKSVVMTALDPDNDGTVSLAEAKRAAEAKFNALDTDHEDTLDANELTGIMSVKQIKATDKDNGGTLDKIELSSEEGRELVAMLAY
jgi:uncharacterized membrane protein YkoI